jgi:glutamate synthase domain-containing protein 1
VLWEAGLGPTDLRSLRARLGLDSGYLSRLVGSLERDGLVTLEADAADAEDWVRTRHPDLRVMSAGSSIEIYKEVGRPEEFARRFDLTSLSGTHALGHTRMATESRVTTEGSHPFSTGLDVCLVHNGSLSNHNRLRERLRREGIEFQTENDTEVAAGYIAWRLREGAALDEALWTGRPRDFDWGD